MSIKISADYKKAFKEADIRGIYPSEIDDEVAYFIGRAFVDEYKYKSVVVGRDMRLSSLSLAKAFIKGVTDAGAEAIDIGLVSSPMMYYVSGTYNLSGVMVTASHSPKNFNGLKLVFPGARPLTEKNGLKAIRKRLESGKFLEIKKPGRVVHKNIEKGYQKKVCRGVRRKDYEKLSLVFDCGNGMAGKILPLLREKFPIDFFALFPELDGNFPNRGSDPTLKKNQKVISELLRAGGYDFGVAFDGDADRIAFFDESGNYINSAVIGAVIADHLLVKEPGAKIGYTNMTSRVYEEEVRAKGGKPVLMRVGHSYIKETMRKDEVLFACEHSGHYFYQEYFYTDSVELTLRYVLEAYNLAHTRGLSFSELMKPHMKYHQIEDVMVMVNDKAKALKQLGVYLENKKPKQLRKFDGYKVDFGTVWGIVKGSVTEPAINIGCEGVNKREALALQNELIEYTKKIAND